MIIGYTALGLEPYVEAGWPVALSTGYGALFVLLNGIAYDICGGYLVQALRKHQTDSGSKNEETNTIRNVILKPTKSMIAVSILSIICVALLANSAAGFLHASRMKPWVPDETPNMNGLQIIFMQVVVEYLYLKLTWLSGTQLKDKQEHNGKNTRGSSGASKTPGETTVTQNTEAIPRNSRTATMDKAKKLSQASPPAHSTGSGPSREPSMCEPASAVVELAIVPPTAKGDVEVTITPESRGEKPSPSNYDELP